METTPFRVAISATFTAEPMEPVLRFWERQLGTPLDVRFANYNQIHQTLAQNDSVFATNRHGVNVAIARLEDLGEFDWHDPATLPLLRSNFEELLSALNRAAAHYPVPLVFVLCPASPAFLSDPVRAALQREMELLAAAPHNFSYLPASRIEQLYPVPLAASGQGERLGRVPYTGLYFCALATALVRFTDGLFRPPFKVIALDCDNTLWKGICGEDGPLGVVLDEDSLALQHFMKAQFDSGMLLALASKNNEQDVADTFAANPAMPLGLAHFAARRVNWQPKAANLLSLARELSLSPESFIFVDDNPKETAEVREGSPEILALTLPQGTEHFLQQVWAFDRWSVTEEDRMRNQTVRQSQEFGRQLQSADNLQHFMESLNLRLTFGRITSDSAISERLARVAQLTQRTNQFNFTGLRRTETELRTALANGLECLTIDVADRFGEYGLTGAVLYRIADRDLRVDTFVLSCRVLGRGVEHLTAAHLAQIALERGATHVVLTLTPTAKNLPAQQFFETLGVGRLDAASLRSLTWKPAPGEAVSPTALANAPAPVIHKRPDYQTIALRFGTARQIFEAMRPASSFTADASLTPAEQQLASIWAELLHVTSIGPNDTFFDLGGHSLLMVQMVIRVREAFDVELSVDDVYSATLTLAALARKIESKRAGEDDEYQALLQEIGALSDEEAARLLEQELLRESHLHEEQASA